MSGTPRMVVYYNANTLPLSDIVGSAYTHVILAFIIPSSSSGGGLTLELSGNLDSAVLADIPAAKESGTRKVMVSVGGETFQSSDWQLASENVPDMATQIVNIVTSNGFDGVDIDFEDDAGFTGTYDGVTFLSDLSTALKSQLPGGSNLVTHAPQPPFFDAAWNGGPYLQIMANAGASIDFLNVQYYNNPWYVTPPNPNIVGDFVTSIPTLAKNPATPVGKLVMGKPIGSSDAGSGWLDVSDLISEITQPLKTQFGSSAGGTMGWQYSSDPGNKWAAAIAAAQT